MRYPPQFHNKRGFTLIELSIVLIIIGLIVGGVLVGKDLIIASEVRSQISQIERYKTAANTFRLKYGYFPGDIPDPTASGFGFTARGTWSSGGQGDGNGLIEASLGNVKQGHAQGDAETAFFWIDLSTAKMIDGNFNTADMWASVTTTTVDLYFPKAKIGRGNYVYVWSGGINAGNGINYYSVSGVNGLTNGKITSALGLSVQAAYNIDNKIDDGLPQYGKITAMYLNQNAPWGSVGRWAGGTPGSTMGANAGASTYGPTNAATAGSTTTCYDNNNIAGPQQYSLSQDNGNNINCALSFQF